MLAALGVQPEEGSLEVLKTPEQAHALISHTGYALIGCFRSPVEASAIFGVFWSIAWDIADYTKKKVKTGYSASYASDPVAKALGVTQAPAILLYRPGKADAPVVMPIPRKKGEFTEELLVEWIQTNLN